MSRRRPVPYADATSGDKARGEITKLLREFGCSKIGFFDDFEEKKVTLQFEHRGQTVILECSAKGWAKMYLERNPWNSDRRTDKVEYERRWIRQGMVAINSVLRDGVKGQLTMVEAGIASFEAVFLGQLALPGTTMTFFEHLSQTEGLPKMLPAPGETA